ncbi:MAG: HGGxSTG domain-containing protein [Dongiaceae bacterium]
MTASAATPSTAGHGLHPPSRSPLRRAKEGRSFPPLPSTASLPADRRGRLRNGARSGDFLAAPRCGARTRAAACCRQPAMANGRCRLHGGLSTGPRTAEGRARCARARLRHGAYSAATRALMAEACVHLRRMSALLGRPSAAGHGVLRPISRKTASGAFIAKGNQRDHGAKRSDPARAVRTPSSSALSASSVVKPSPAGHGLLPSVSRASIAQPVLPVRRLGFVQRTLLGGTALGLGLTIKPPAAAGHGVLRSFSTSSSTASQF